VDGSGLAREIFTSQAWSVLPCVRPVEAAPMTAGIMPSADQVPVRNTHSMMRWHKWVVLTAGSTGSALRAVRPPNLHITPVLPLMQVNAVLLNSALIQIASKRKLR